MSRIHGLVIGWLFGAVACTSIAPVPGVSCDEDGDCFVGSVCRDRKCVSDDARDAETDDARDAADSDRRRSQTKSPVEAAGGEAMDASAPPARTDAAATDAIDASAPEDMAARPDTAQPKPPMDAGSARPADAGSPAPAMDSGAPKPVMDAAPPPPPAEPVERCGARTCKPGGTCRDVPTGVECSCKSGYVGTGTNLCRNSRYVLTEKTTTDKMTGLEWIRGIGSDQTTRSTHDAYCAQLQDAGGGWRMPTIEELETLIDLSVEEAGMPKIDYSAFHLWFEDNERYWMYSSSSDAVEYPGQLWGIEFATGKRTWFAPQFILSRVRCVRD